MKRSHHGILSRLLALCVLLALFPFLLAANFATLGATRIIFLHHSCGENLINEGGVREGLTVLGYEFYDHGYNDDGLRLADGSYSGDNFDVPNDNTDPDGLAEIFAQPLHDPPDNTFSYLMQYDVIAFKSCFPTSNIGDDDQLNEYKSYYLSIRDRVDQYPDKIFIVVTQPPQVPAESNPQEGARARALADWLSSDEFLTGHPNLFTFDFFGHLAGSDNFLRAEYRVDDYDAHPNEQANRAIGPLFVNFIDQAINSYESGTPLRPTPTAPAEPPSPGEKLTPGPIVAPSAAGMIDDFESAAVWDIEAEEGSTLEYELDDGVAHSGAASLRIGYTIADDGWGDCGRSFDPPQDWSGSTGLSLWLHSGGRGEWYTLMLFSGDPDDPTPFEVDFETSTESDDGWVQLTFPWEDLEKAEWADEGGLTEPDLTRITGYGFSIGAGAGALWVDDVSLTGMEQPPQPEPTAPPTAAPGQEPTEEPGGEPEKGSGGGICPGAAVLPLGTIGLLLASRKRRA